MNDHDIAPGGGTSARLALARVLRDMHKRSNRTLRAIERDISVSDSTLSRYFRGKAVPSWATVEKICAAFGEDPAAVRHLWTVAVAERSDAELTAVDPDAASPARDRESTSSPTDEEHDRARAAAIGGAAEVEESRAARFRRRIVRAPRSRAVSLVAGLVLGFALGAAVTAVAVRGGAAPPTQSQGAPAPATTGTYCPWKYVVTDGEADNVRVFDDPQRDSIIAEYAPNEVFYVADPPQIVNGMMRTEHGWISTGSWVQRYAGSACHTGER